MDIDRKTNGIHHRTWKMVGALVVTLGLLCGCHGSPTGPDSAKAPGKGPPPKRTMQPDAASGTYANPRGWNVATTVGAIHYYRGMFFSAKFNGNAADHNWYFPTTPVSSASWEYIDTPVSWITTADPQYPWTEQTDIVGSTESEATRKTRSEAFIRAQYQSMEQYRKSRPDMTIPIIINGDITAFGHGNEWSKMQDIFRQEFPEGNYYFGLGNHDYENNVDECGNNGCARDSLFALERLAMLRNLPLNVTTATRSTTYTGSFTYIVYLGPVMLVQLNNSPTYTRDFSAGDGFFTPKYHFHVTPSILSLRYALIAARAINGVVIINVHRPDADTDRNLADSALPKMMNDYDVPAVYAGHLHSSFGQTSHLARWGNTPVFNSSSPFYKKYLISEYYPKQKILRIYAVTNNSPGEKEIIREITVRSVK